MTHEYHLPVFEMIMAVITIFVFIVFAIVLICIIIHLISKIYTKYKSEDSDESNELVFLYVTSIAGVLSFELSLVIIIIMVLQILLMDHKIKQSMIHSDFFFETYHLFQYLIAIFDSLGHLSSLLVFIYRFQYTFQNQIFNPSPLLILFMYITLAILTMIAFIILLYIIPFETNKGSLLIWEIVWELCVESVILFILFLFVFNLHKVLKLSLMNHITKKKSKNEFLVEIANCNTKPIEKNSNMHENQITMTIDGNYVEPTTPGSQNVSASIDISKRSSIISQNGIPSQSFELLSVMSKLTLLVIVAASGSFITIIGNLIIEKHGMFNEKDIATNQEIDHDAIWVFILPATDMVLTSFMLYLQFNFTDKTYRIMCNCLDKVFLKCMLSIIWYSWKTPDDASFIVDKSDAKSTVELETKSPTMSDLNQTQSQSHLQIPNVMR